MSEIDFYKEGHIATIIMNRPEKLNALTQQMRVNLRRYAHEADTDSSIRVIVVKSASEKSFCVGADITETIGEFLNDEKNDDFIGHRKVEEPTQRIFSTIETPIICSVRGYCFGGGLEILLGSDIRIVSENAVFALPEVTRGFFPAGGGTVRLPRQISYCNAMEICLSGAPIDASRALSIGLVNSVVSSDELDATTAEYAERLSANSKSAMQRIKKSVLMSHGISWDNAFLLEGMLGKAQFQGEDAREGRLAFLEKRKPIFK